MATNTYVALRTTTLASAQASVDLDLTGVTGYTDLVLVFQAKLTASNAIKVQYNGVTTNTYAYTRLYGTGSTGVSDTAANASYFDAGFSASNTVNQTIQIMNYANTTTFKTALSRASTEGGTQVFANTWLWRNTGAITSIQIAGVSGNLDIGSTFTLYGIASSNIGAPKAFGGTITQDATYTYHTFGASGTFVPQQSLTADVLVVAGGGGGGAQQAGGGGAGGLLGFASQSLTAQNYTVTVGSGGAGSSSYGSRGVNGGNSQFGALTACVGGGGAGSFSDSAGGANTGASGGSGGGGATYGQSNNSNAGGAGTSGQGNAGGTGELIVGSYRRGGGGGGAGGAGANASAGGSGGLGVNTTANYGSFSTTLTAVGIGVNGYLAGGGGAGDGIGTVTGGGGIGGNGIGVTISNGVANTGGGGGGAYNGAGAAGGSGVVIIRYAN